jgi:D-alanyl-D-alanine carboxypeptidase
MSINRDRLARLGATLALLATVVLQGPAAAAGQQAAVAVRGAAAAQAAGQQAAAAPVSLGSRSLAVPGALSVSPGGAGLAGSGGTGAGSSATGVTGASGAGTGVPPPAVRAGSVLLADEGTGQVLFERAARQPRAMASTTKVMTALLTLEHLDQRRTVVIGTEPTTVGEESLELRKGERLTVHQLLLGLLVKSANDAAVALADAVDGSAAAFVERMNGRAAQLGLRDTHYVTPYGLDRPGHRTSARDLARLWEVAMRRADFRALVSTRGARIPGPPRLREFTSTNHLLGSYPWMVGGKTGFTSDAGRCLVASASRGGRRLVAVALGSPDAFADVRALFEYGFTAFDWVRLAQRGQAVTLAGAAGQATAYQVTADVDAMVRRDLLDELALAPPSQLVATPAAPSATEPATVQAGSAQSGGTLTVWIQAGGRRLAPMRLGPPGSAAVTGLDEDAPANPGQAIPPMSAVSAGLVPPGSVAGAIDPFLRRAAS